MKYFLDTEFIEGFRKSLFGKKRHFIDLISIGIYCEDGREYHEVSSEYNYKDADDWVKSNVIDKLYIDTVHGDSRNYYSTNNFHRHYGKKNEWIAEEVLRFFGCWRDQHFWRAPEGIEVYAYFADYDWVLFCSLFGRMIDLPRGFPMYCIDLKQSLDEFCKGNDGYFGESMPFKDRVHIMKPEKKNEHNALADAKWNYKLHENLNILQ